MPIYCNNNGKVGAALSWDLLQHLKGKACFHIKGVDKDLLQHIKYAMKIGYEAYKKNGWL